MKAVIWGNNIHVLGEPCTISSDDTGVSLEDVMGVRILTFISIPGLSERYQKDRAFRDQAAAFIAGVFNQFLQQDQYVCLDLADSLLNTKFS